MHETHKKESIEDNAEKTKECRRRHATVSEKNCERKRKGGTMKVKKDGKNEMMSGSKDLCGDSTRKRNFEKANNNVTFIALQKNMRSMHSSERIEEMV